MELALGFVGFALVLLILFLKWFSAKGTEPIMHKLHNQNETLRVLNEELKSLKSSVISLKLGLIPKPLPPSPPKEPEDPVIEGAAVDSLGNCREYEVIPTMPELHADAPVVKAKPSRKKASKKKTTRRK